MDNKMSEWWRNLPVCLHLTPSRIPDTSPDILPKLLFVHTVYHQCLIALHASIVPVFSWIPGDESWLAARQTSAQLAFDHACVVSDLFDGVLTHFPMLSALPSFVAYAAYCGCAVQIPFMWSSDVRTKEMVHRNVKNNIEIIKALSQYWKYTSLLQIYIQHLYRTHAKRATVLENQPKHIDSTELTGSKFDASTASTTILGFNRILWSKTGRCAEVGEEITDLGMDDDDSEVQSIQGREFCLHISLNFTDLVFLLDKEVADSVTDHAAQQHAQQNSLPLASFDPNINSQAPGWDELQPDLYNEFQDYPDINSFRPLDPAMWGVDGSLFDPPQLSTAPLSPSFPLID